MMSKMFTWSSLWDGSRGVRSPCWQARCTKFLFLFGSSQRVLRFWVIFQSMLCTSAVSLSIYKSEVELIDWLIDWIVFMPYRQSSAIWRRPEVGKRLYISMFSPSSYRSFFFFGFQILVYKSWNEWHSHILLKNDVCSQE